MSTQLSLFDLLTPEPPKGEEPKEFIIWYANMSGKGEHIYARWWNGNTDFAPRQAIIDAAAEPILYTFTDVWEAKDKHHAQLGKMVWSGKSYEIEDLWNLSRPTTL